MVELVDVRKCESRVFETTHWSHTPECESHSAGRHMRGVHGNKIDLEICPDGGTGRHGGLKILFRKNCGFKSRSGHQDTITKLSRT